MSFGVYGIFFPDNYVYIGSTITDVKIRHRVHKHALTEGNHDNAKMQELYNKYHTLEFEMLDDCTELEGTRKEIEEKVRQLEQYYIEDYQRKGYNLCNEATALLDGYALSDAIKKKISDGVKYGSKSKREPKEKKQKASFITSDKTISECHKINLEMRKEQGW